MRTADNIVYVDFSKGKQAVAVPAFPVPQQQSKFLTFVKCELVVARPEVASEEVYHELITGYHQLCHEVLSRHNGACLSLVGEEALIYFGYPESCEKDTQRAVQSAFDIIDRVGELIEDHSFSQSSKDMIGVRIGIHSCFVMVTEEQAPLSFSSRELSIASELMKIAKPNQIVTSQTLKNQIAGEWYTASMPVTAAGQKVFEIKGSRINETRFGVRQKIGLTPFVGRTKYIEAIESLWVKASQSVPQTVAIQGEAGIGKTRLIHEVDFTESKRVVIQCSLERQGKSFHAIAVMLRKLLALHDSDSSKQQLAKLEGALIAAGVDLQIALPLMASVLELELKEGVHDQAAKYLRKNKDKFEILEKLLKHFSQSAPLCVVWEDLHWADSDTREFIEFWDSRPYSPDREQRCMFILSSREDLELKGKNSTSISLDALWEAEIQQMVKTLVPESRYESLVNYVLRRSGGNPLFVEELAKTLAEHKYVEQIDDVPTGLIQLLSMKVDQLGREKKLLQLASVLGNRFDKRHLKKLSPWSDDEFELQINALVVRHRAIERSQECPVTYQFRHALFRDATYSTLTPADKKRLHEEVAELLIAKGDEMSVIAGHLEKAEQWADAGEFWYEASEEAYSRIARRLRFQYLARADYCLAKEDHHLPSEVHQIIKLGLFDEKSEKIRMCSFKDTLFVARVARGSNHLIALRAAAMYASFLRKRGKHQLAKQYLQRAQQVLEICPSLKEDDEMALFRTYMNIYYSGFFHGDKHWQTWGRDELIQLARKSENTFLMPQALGMELAGEQVAGNAEKTLELANKAIASSSTLPYWRVWAFICKYWALSYLGEDSSKDMEAAVKNYEPISNPHAVHHVHHMLAEVYLNAYRYEDCEKTLQFAIRNARETGFCEHLERLLDTQKVLNNKIMEGSIK